MVSNSTNFTLTSDQQNAINTTVDFILDKSKEVLVIEGYSGVGKSTLVRNIVDQIPALMGTLRLLEIPDYELVLTASTHKAAQNLSKITGMAACTSHSFFKLRLTDVLRNGKWVKDIVPTNPDLIMNKIIILEEASFYTSRFLQIIFPLIKNCKLIFIGDPAQLINHMSGATAPVFNCGFDTVKLTQVVRHDGLILNTVTAFRYAVETGKFPIIELDGNLIKHLPRKEFLVEAETEFNRPNWTVDDSRILCWRNNTSVSYNNHIQKIKSSGSDVFELNDYVVCNSFTMNGSVSVKTDSYLQIKNINHNQKFYDVAGFEVMFHETKGAVFFVPYEFQEMKKVENTINDGSPNALSKLRHIASTWIDIRGVYSSTIDKAQGSTFKKVFMDISDVYKCHNSNQLARLMYVGLGRASEQLVLTGDFGKG